MDYAARQRLKILGRARIIEAALDRTWVARLEHPHYRARVERAIVITVEAFDWNCPQHITPRFTQDQVQAATQPLRDRIQELEARLGLGCAAKP